jgi:hypothetical protein
MFVIQRFGKTVKTFGTAAMSYEEARSAIRRHIRKNKNQLEAQMESRRLRRIDKWTRAFFDFLTGEFKHRNPAIQSYGYNIKKVS